MTPNRPTPKAGSGPASPAKDDRQARAMRWAQVTARDLMRSDLVTIPASAPLSEIERILGDSKVSGAPVVDSNGKIVGILSWRDVIDRYTEDPDARPRREPGGFFEVSTHEMFEEDYEPFEVPAESEETAADIMTSEIYTVPPDAGLREIAAVMAKHGIHRILVEENGRYLGLVGTLEILNALSA